MSTPLQLDKSGDCLREFYQKISVPQPTVLYFSSYAWTRQCLQSPLYEARPFFARYPKRDGEDNFFGSTLNGPSKIAHILSLHLKHSSALSQSESLYQARFDSNQKSTTFVSNFDADLIVIVRLGKYGVNGHVGVVHGGLINTLLESAMGELLAHRVHVNYSLYCHAMPSFYIVSMKTSFLVPAPVDAIFLIKVWLLKQEGRKISLHAQLVNQDKIVLAHAEALWISTTKSKL